MNRKGWTGFIVLLTLGALSAWLGITSQAVLAQSEKRELTQARPLSGRDGSVPASSSASNTDTDTKTITITVSNVQAQQYGSFVRVLYDLAVDPAETVTVNLIASTDGGITYNAIPASVCGAVGENIQPGLSKVMVWNVYMDLPEQQIAESAVRIDTTPAADPASTPESSCFELDTRLEFLDVNGDSTPDDFFDLDQDGTPDASQDFDGNGIPDAFEDTDSNCTPDAYQDLNSNGTPDGFEDSDGNHIPDFFQEGYAVYSPSHPNGNEWYFTRDFRAEWPTFYPEGGGYLWIIDQNTETIVDYSATFQTATTLEHTVDADGLWYLHLAAVDAENFLIPDSQVDFAFRVRMTAPMINSMSHPDSETPEFNKDFQANTFCQEPSGTWFGQWPMRYKHTSLVFDNKIWVLGGGGVNCRNDVWCSSDGVTWKCITANADWSPRDNHTSVVFDNKMWIIGGRCSSEYYHDVWWSVDGMNWTQATANAGWDERYGHSSVVFNNKIWVIGGYRYIYPEAYYYKDVWWSEDGVTWNQVTTYADWDGRYGHTSVVFNNKMWIIGGYSYDYHVHSSRNDVWWSEDGLTWTQATANAGWPERYYHTSLIFDNKLWVLGRSGDNSDVWWSEDGVTWIQATADADWPARVAHTSVVFDNKMWVLGGTSDLSDVWWSENGVTWTKTPADAAWSAREDHTSVVFKNKLWILGGGDNSGSSNDVWWSEDGVDWTQATDNAAWPRRYGHASVVFDNKLWVLGGYAWEEDNAWRNDVWWSEDGINWNEANSNALLPARYGHTSVVFDNKMWLLGGYAWEDGDVFHNDVWWSENGVSWNQATANADWSARYNHTSVVFKDKIWVLGGNDGFRRGDVWWSENGVTWTQATVFGGWSRSGHTSVVFNNKLWVLGGENTDYYNDVWWSEEGVTWYQVIVNSNWSARTDHASAVFDNKLWVLGGRDSIYGLRNDVSWYSFPAIYSAFNYIVDETPGTLPLPGADTSLTGEITVPGNAPGEHWFHVVAVDSVGQTTPPAHYKFIVKDAPPSVTSPTHPTEMQGYSGAEVTMKWNSGGVPDVERYYYAFNQVEDTTPSTAIEAETITFDCVAPGTWWFHVRSEDKYGYLSPIAHRRVLVSVTPGPDIFSTSHPDEGQSYALRDVDLAWTPAEFSNAPYYYLWDDNPNTIPDEGSLSTSVASLPTIENLDLGSYYLHVRATDDCGDLTETDHFAVHLREAHGPVIQVLSSSNPGNIQFVWTDPDAFAMGSPRFYYVFDGEPYTEPTHSSSSTNNEQRNELGVAPGMHYMHVRGQDLHGNLSATGHYGVVVGDVLVGLSAPSETITTTGPVSYTVTYPGATSVSLSTSDVTLNKTGSANGFVTVQGTAEPLVKQVVISIITGDGTLGISLAAGTASYPDKGSAPAVGPSATFTVDNTPPLLTIGDPNPAFTAHGPVTYTLTYEGATNILLSEGDITLVSELAGEVGATMTLSGDGNTRTVTLSDCWGEGQLHIEVAAGTASDDAGHLAPAASGTPFAVDNTPPTLAVSAPAPSLTNTGPVVYTITYSGADVVSLSEANVHLVTTDTAAASSYVVSGTGNAQRLVTISGITGNGTIGLEIDPGTAQDNAGNLTEAATGVPFSVDNTAPEISISEPAVPLTTTGPVTYTVLYSGADSVLLDPGHITLVANGAKAMPTATITVTGTDLTERLITLSAITGDGTLGISLAEGTATDSAGNNAPAASGNAFTVDNTAPGIALSTPFPSLTQNGPVTCTVTYSGADEITLTAENIALETVEGEATGNIALSVTGDDTRSITIDSLSGDGVLRVSIPANSAHDLAGNQAAAANGETFTVDNTPPQVTLGPPSLLLTNTGPVEYQVNYTGAQMILLAPEDVTLESTPSGAASGTVTILGTGTSVRTLRISNISGDGTLRPLLAPDTARDLAGNTALGAEGTAFTVDNTPPAITISEPSAPSSSGQPITYTVTYQGASEITLVGEDITINATGDASALAQVSGTGPNTRLVTLANPSGYGTLGISIAPGTAHDEAGNVADGAGPSTTFSVSHYTLLVEVNGSGTTVPAPGSYLMQRDDQIIFEATPDSGWGFLYWMINDQQYDDQTLEWTITGDTHVIAYFERLNHTADQNGDYLISLSELLRVIQFFNSNGYHCQSGTEDGFAPGPGDTACSPHASDYNPQDWLINLSELLRIIQFFNSGGYHSCEGSEDNFCPGQ